MNKEQKDVAAFHRAMDQAILPEPGVPSAEVVYLRARLVTEEFGEFIAALSGVDADDAKRLVDHLQQEMNAYFLDEKEPARPNLVDLADAIADLKYVLEGTNLAFGIDGEPVWDAVQAANMAKAGGPVSPEGKRLKPPGWTPPDIRQVLIDQGWTPPKGS